MANAVVDRVKQPAWIIIGAGFLALVVSFLPWYRTSADFAGSTITDSHSAWYGFFGLLGTLLLVTAAGATAWRVFLGSKQPLLPLAALVSAGVGCGCVFLGLFVKPFTGLSLYIQLYGIQIRHSFGNWISLVCALAMVFIAYRLYTQPAK